jgi:hypothetical protein
MEKTTTTTTTTTTNTNICQESKVMFAQQQCAKRTKVTKQSSPGRWYKTTRPREKKKKRKNAPQDFLYSRDINISYPSSSAFSKTPDPKDEKSKP